MSIDEFIEAFADEFEDTPTEEFNPDTVFKSLDEWNSLTALSITFMVKDAFGKKITGADLRACKTIAELYNLIQNK